jgi:two-component system sensor histidine kinase ResE
MKIIDELLDLARIEAGQLQIQKTSVNVGDLIADVAEGCQALALEKQISLQQAVDAVSGVYLNGDEGKLHQVLTNLVHNAVKFTPAGGQVQVEAVLKDQGRIELCVRDTGPGIPTAELPKIFDKFYSAPSAPPGTQGAGLGLTISKSLVDLHGGKLWVASTDQGSSFYVDLPLDAGQSSPIP